MGRCAVGVTNNTRKDPPAFSWFLLLVKTSFLTSPLCCWDVNHLTPGKVSLDVTGRFVLAGGECISSVKSADKGLLTGAGTAKDASGAERGTGGPWER